jgi:hypothetical protein
MVVEIQILEPFTAGEFIVGYLETIKTLLRYGDWRRFMVCNLTEVQKTRTLQISCRLCSIRQPDRCRIVD